ncbi:MAG: DUF2393 domain-containing protein [Acidobacteriia bacterium]|nr:DUF2393 domain-containing protein [Terriglobia bacterium]
MAIDASTRRKMTFGPALYVALAVAAAGAAAVGYLEFGKSRPAAAMELTPEAKQFVRNLQLSDVTMEANQSFANQLVVEIQGKIGNGGDRDLEVVEIYCVFHDSYGQTVLRKRMPIVSAKMGGLKPGETKGFRLAFDELPGSWNHAMPSLVIAGIKFTG